jgi:hypothetical protein
MVSLCVIHGIAIVCGLSLQCFIEAILILFGSGVVNGVTVSTGRAYVFSTSGSLSSWSQVAILNASDASADAEFGLSVSYDTSSATAVVGAPFAGSIEK